MKHWKQVLFLLLWGLLASGMVGCIGEAPSATETAPTVQRIDGRARYVRALEKLDNVPDMTLEITSVQKTTVGGETFSESSTQTLQLQGLGTDSFRSLRREALDYDGYPVTFEDVFVEGTLYTTVRSRANAYFSGAMTAEEYRADCLPPAILNEDLYGSITVTGSGILSFSEPSSLEDWMAPEEAELIEAAGTVVLGTDGELVRSTYTSSYTYGPAQVELSVTVSVDTTSPVEITPPADPTAFAPLECVSAPRMIGSAVGMLRQADSLDAIGTERIVSQAAGVARNQRTEVHAWGTGSDKMADVAISVYLTDASQGEKESRYSQTEHFENGIYTLAAEGGEPTPQSGVNAAVMDTYIRELLLKNLYPSDALETAAAADLGGVCLLEVTLSRELGREIADQACSTLFQDKDLLDNLASDFLADAVEGYLAVDKYTGLPTAVGLNFVGSHTIDGTAYAITVRWDQSIHLASLSAYEAITGEIPEAPEESATPLFYHVTGKDGQEMWLLGTIPVGDHRVNCLPKEIYEAFDGADALAVEFDAKAFEKRAQEDGALRELLARAYCYDDGTTAQDHLDGALLEAAAAWMKASGNNSANLLLTRPSGWRNALENFYIQQGYHLTPENGVDSRLLERAKAQGKKILEIESGVTLVNRMADFPDPVQELLLDRSVSVTPGAYQNALDALFEAWCRGDGDTMEKRLAGIGTNGTREEQALYETYRNIMLTDRNQEMLRAAKSYLESGDRVFYAVGVAHLLAEDGLMNALRDAGYTVEPVIYS